MPKRPTLPSFIPPQLSQIVKAPPEAPDWAHEMEYDGHRVHARLVNGKVTLLTGTRLDRTDAQRITAQPTCFRTRNP
jgi:bifunctional non-homologous end joining protein LigD